MINGSQQQWITRNSEVGEWTNAVWNQVFAGVVGAPADAGYPDPPYTTLDSTPLSREKPYLFVDDDGRLERAGARARSRHSRGISWAERHDRRADVPLSRLLRRRPRATRSQTINNQLARGKHLLLTPGVYDVDRSIEVKRADTVVLGLGQATLTAVGGATPLQDRRPAGHHRRRRDDRRRHGGVAGAAAGRQAQRQRRARRTADPRNPTTLSDVYFRVGGPHVGKADVALEVNSDHVLIDHTWVWRADHGVEGFDPTDGFLGDNERWATNIGRNGVVVNGDDVTATGLFVEHFQQHNTVWNGERGRVVLYQNELPYDPPTQADWTTAGRHARAGPAYKVADHVQQHQLWGGGVYVYNRNNPDIVTENGYEVPDDTGRAADPRDDQEPQRAGHHRGTWSTAWATQWTASPTPGDPDGYEDPSYVVSYP